MAIRRNPFDEMDRMIDQMRRSMFAAPTMGAMDREYDDEFEGRMLESGSDLNVTMETTDEGYVVLADLPGFEKEEIDLRFDEGYLVISAEREISEDAEGVRRRRNRRVFERVSVPGSVVETDIGATYRNGVLEILLPVEESVDADAHRIDID